LFAARAVGLVNLVLLYGVFPERLKEDHQDEHENYSKHDACYTGKEKPTSESYDSSRRQ